MELHIRKVQIQGGSHCVNLPKAVLNALEIQKGDYFCYNVFPGGMVQVSKFEPHKYQREIELETAEEPEEEPEEEVDEGKTQDQEGVEDGPARSDTGTEDS